MVGVYKQSFKTTKKILLVDAESFILFSKEEIYLPTFF